MKMNLDRENQLLAQHIRNGECVQGFLLIVATFMSKQHGPNWRERGHKVDWFDKLCIALIILLLLVIFVTTFLFHLFKNIAIYSFGEHGIFREIAHMLRR